MFKHKSDKIIKFCCLTGGFMHWIKSKNKQTCQSYVHNKLEHSQKYFIPQAMYNLIEITPRLTIFQLNKSPCRV